MRRLARHSHGRARQDRQQFFFYFFGESKRFAAEARGLVDRSSRPHRLSAPTTWRWTAQQIRVLRRQRWTGKHIAKRPRPRRHRPARVLNAWAEQVKALEPGRADPPLRAPVTRRDRSTSTSRSSTLDRLGHRITAPPGQQHSRASAGSSSMVGIDDASRLAFSQFMPIKKNRAPSPPKAAWLTTNPHPRHHGRPGG